MTSQAQKDAEALAEIADIVWAALSETNIPQGQIAEVLGAIIGLLGRAYREDRAGYLSEPQSEGTSAPDPGPF